MAGAPGQMGTQSNAQQAVSANSALRNLLLASAPPMRKSLGNFSGGTLGSLTRIKIFNVGVTTRLCLDVQMKYDVVTAAMVPSTKAPWNILNQIKLTDYDQTDRVNCSGFQLWVWNCVRRKGNYAYNNSAATQVFNVPVQPVAVGANNIAEFCIEIPVAFDPVSDLRGAMLTQTAVGEAYINLTWNPLGVSATANPDAIFTSSTGTLANVTFNVTVSQEYLLPQNVQGVGIPIPPLDIQTVYEFAGNIRSSDNVAAGAEKLFNYPNVRSVIASYFNFINNSVMNPATTDITKFRVLANGANTIKEYSATEKLFEQRIAINDGSDLRPGTYFELHRQKPIETALYGAFQYGITPSAVSGVFNFEIGYESFYTKGMTLPGLSQSS